MRDREGGEREPEGEIYWDRTETARRLPQRTLYVMYVLVEEEEGRVARYEKASVSKKAR